MRSLRFTALLFLAALLPSLPTPAHDIPTDVKVFAFVKPEGRELHLLVRVPLAAMREADLPLRYPGYIDIPNAGPALETAARLWLVDNITVRENDAPVAAPRIAGLRVAIASDRSFTSYAEALANLRRPALTDTDLYWKHQYLDVLLDYPIASERSDFVIHPKLDRLGLQVLLVMRYLPPGGTERAFELHGDPGPVSLDPGWLHAALRFVDLGFRHILDGADHLLFIACLVIPLRRVLPVVAIATAFTVAHSITLAASAFGFAPDGLWFAPLVETLIAVSIVFMALENILGGDLRWRWMIAFGFGLVHGFGFAFALRDSLQFAGDHLLTALFAFNVGVELGQVAVLLVLIPVLGLLFRYVPERLGVIVLSAIVAHTGWHWMLERWATLRKFNLPAFDASTAASLMGWLVAAIVLVMGLVAVDRALRRWARHDDRQVD